ncbi:hypothetical protein CHS0354_016211 [Potamilus streckersoni]|uniref:Uncharacterized protein n=1 Tax=Potamilus streckersoni TaxID=2493646 RepID=A0AAE0RXA5_9BIVA|nr:hypothetical protein CHS0354_016211 [Potamilus streckersoni]
MKAGLSVLFKSGSDPVHCTSPAFTGSSLWCPLVVVEETGEAPCPEQLYLRLNAGHPCLLEDFSVGDEVTPVDVEDGAKGVLIEAFKEAEMTAIGDPGFCAI